METYEDKRREYTLLSQQYAQNLVNARNRNGGFSSSRQRCWNACSELSLLRPIH